MRSVGKLGYAGQFHDAELVAGKLVGQPSQQIARGLGIFLAQVRDRQVVHLLKTVLHIRLSQGFLG